VTADASLLTGPGSRAAIRARSQEQTSRSLFAFDRDFGVRYVAGADEAGRGCLAGPLVAAAVLFDYERLDEAQVGALGALNDSKQQSVGTRELLYPVVLKAATRVAIVIRSPLTIDQRGLHVTNLAALGDGLLSVATPGCICLSDGFAVRQIGYNSQAIVGGDALSASIAAASIIAKVTRDRLMTRADALHPGYLFAKHFGYATAEHRSAIVKLGVTPLHRLSFRSAAYKQIGITPI